MNNKISYIKHILCVLSFLVLIDRFGSTSLARECTIEPGEPGCCTYEECGPMTNICFGPYDTVPTKCPASEGECICGLGYPGYCNSAVIGSCWSGGLGEIHQCDKCCCTLAGSPPPGGGGHDPGGWLDSASCNNGIISTGGWTCDQDNYSKSLDVKIYMDGTSSSNLIASGTASLTRESTVCEACGGTCNHGFGISTSGTYCGTHDVYAYGVNVGGGSDHNLLGSPKTVDCGTCCTPVNGGWSGWSSCNNCSQSRTCTNPPPSCGGANCSGPYTQACGKVDGTLGTWSTCSTSCGPGTQTATCTKEATCGGTTCSTLCSNAGGTYSGTTCTRSCNLGPCNQNPKGNFDSVSCGSDPTSPNFHKIRVRGWACDPDNYSSPISVHVYNGTSSSGTKIGSGTANLPGELAIGSHCGGTTSHRFDILSAGTFAPGTYSINTYGINTPPGTNPLLSSSPKSVTCCAPTNGSLGAWGSCSNGSQTSTCSGFSCVGNCSAECSAEKGTYNPSTHVCTRST